jgi:MFS family permease
MFAMLTMSMSFCYFIKVVFKNYGNINFNDDAFLTQVAGTSFLCGASFRFIWGSVQDFIGFKRVYAIILFFLTVLAFTLHEVGTRSKTLYQVYIGLIFAMEGGHFSIFPAVACTIYGAQLGSKVYSLLFIGTALASFIGLLVANLVLPLFGWAAVYMIFAVICLLSLFLLLVFEEKPLKVNPT